MNFALPDLIKNMESSEPLSDILNLSSDSLPLTPLLKDIYNFQPPLVHLPDPNYKSDQQKLQFSWI